MTTETAKIDQIDRKILSELQQDAGISQRELADRVGLSQNACWRRLQRLHADKVIRGSSMRVDHARFGLDLTAFVMIKTRHHSRDWATAFRRHVDTLPEVVEVHRIGGEWDYMVKVVTRGMGGYDAFYQRLVDGQDLAAVTGYFAMETLVETRPPNIMLLPSAGR